MRGMSLNQPLEVAHSSHLLDGTLVSSHFRQSRVSSKDACTPAFVQNGAKVEKGRGNRQPGTRLIFFPVIVLFYRIIFSRRTPLGLAFYIEPAERKTF